MSNTELEGIMQTSTGGRPAGREALLSRAFVTLADTLVDDYDVIDLLDRLVGYCVELLDAEAAGILLGRSCGELRLVAASSDDAQLMELLQIQAEEGPCLDCYRDAVAVSVSDVSQTGGRWPTFAAAAEAAAAAAQRGTFRAVHALPMRLRGEAIGAMNLFHSVPGPLPDADLVLAQALADVATIGILSARAIHRGEVLNEQLQTALDSRVVIEQAKGVLAERGALPMDAAFDRLRRYSRDRNLRLSEVARQVVDADLAADVLTAGDVRRR